MFLTDLDAKILKHLSENENRSPRIDILNALKPNYTDTHDAIGYLRSHGLLRFIDASDNPTIYATQEGLHLLASYEFEKKFRESESRRLARNEFCSWVAIVISAISIVVSIFT